MQNQELIRDYLLSNLVNPDKRRIGVEIECLIHTKDGNRLPVNPSRTFSSVDLMDELESRQRRDNPKSWYSLEPGGQLEWASPPESNLFEIRRCFDRHLARMTEIRNRYGFLVLDYSLEPVHHPQEIELIRQRKYELMHARFLTTGSRGPWMMRNSTSVQINIDYCSIEEAGEMAFLADALTPIAAGLFAHSPFAGSRPASKENLRAIIWSRTDPARCGSLWNQGIRSPQNFVDHYAQWAATVPLMFIPDENGGWQSSSLTGGEWLQSRTGTENSAQDTLILLHQIFTHVRFKNVLELRGVDRPPFGYELAPPAWWLGLLTREDLRRELVDRVLRWTDDERQALEQTAFQVDWTQPAPENRSLESWIRELSQLAMQGLISRRNATGVDETVYLQPFLEQVLARGPFAIQRQTDFLATGESLPAYIQQQFKDRVLLHESEIGT
ncbi:MAG: glutamate-cysteine ligase family protein [Fidelibacterota bacterium]